jgi:hypothetical protein
VPVDTSAFAQALAAYLASPEGRAELKPFIDAALEKVSNPFVRAALTLFVEAAISAELAKLNQQ